MWQRFTERARQIVYRAQEQAGLHETSHVTPEHLLLGLTLVEDNMGRRILDALGLSPIDVFRETEALLPPGEGKPGEDLILTPRSKRVIDLAYDEARNLKHSYIGGEHLLLGLLREKESIAAVTLAKHGLNIERVREQLQELLNSGSRDELPQPRPGLEGLAAKISSIINADDDKRQEELLSLDEAAQFLGTSKPTLYRVLGQGDLKGLKVGRQWRFRKADLLAYAERSPVAVAAPASDLDAELAFFRQQYGKDRDSPAPVSPDAVTGPGEQKIIDLSNWIIVTSIDMRASDIHLEPAREEGETFLRLRYRVDGVLQEIRRLPMSVSEALMMRFKYMADIRLNEKRMPQEGRIPVRYQGKDFDLRLSTVPAASGEAMTMRILDKSNALLSLENLGLSPDDLGQMRDLLRRPNGLLLVTGPTGSGKTTTLYSCLQEIAHIEKKVLTVEDPVEVQLAYTTQVQVNKRAGLTFPAALRSFMRQDPDILYVGEVRDLETARIAVEASLTGHLVLLALHANEAPAALSRLLEMGLEPYLVAATVTGVLAQQLCRKICDACKEAYEVQARELMRFGLEPDDPDQTLTLYRGRGCEQCRQRGFRGRTGLFELLVMTEEIADLIVARASQVEIVAAARAAGMNSLWQDGLLKVLDGVTTPDEVMRVCSTLM